MTRKPDYKTYDPEKYAANYANDLSYEQHLIEARHECCKRFLADKTPETVLEVGCGPSLLLDRMGPEFDFIRNWHLVEPSTTYATPARDRFAEGTPFGAGFTATIGYLEEEAGRITDDGRIAFDAVVLSGLIHETTDPERMLSTARQMLKPGGWVYVLVPNGLSMHRLLAQHMGLINDPSAITDRNVLLGQSIVYTPDSLKALIDRDGRFENYEFSGHTLKLFTNPQMAEILARFGDALAPALDRLGRDFPENAAEFAWVAQRK